MRAEEIKKLDLPAGPGCYRFYGRRGRLLYIGKAANLKTRVLSYWRPNADLSPAKIKMVAEVCQIRWTTVDSEIEALLLEANLIKKYQPPYNILLRDDKRFQYIKISTEDEIPGVFATRQIGPAGRYFGPFTSGLAVRETLRALRKIWPYCLERKAGKKICFSAQVGRCCGVCGRRISLADYQRLIIRPISQFLAGGKEKLMAALEKERARLARQLAKSPAGAERERLIEQERILAKQIDNFRHVLASAKILSLGDKYAADVVELAKILSLPRVPRRIEGFDIANLFDTNAVGAMVVFGDGEPDKNAYRLFKIRSAALDDTQRLREVLTRRFSHTGPDPAQDSRGKKTKQDWPRPDLLIIDGGLGQLRVAQAVLRGLEPEVPVLAVAKSGQRSASARDKIFFPGEKKPLELPLASPALHVIKRVRDEAHRFAISYHRFLRKKNFLPGDSHHRFSE